MPVRTLGVDLQQARGRVADVSKDRRQLSINSAGQQIDVQMPEGQAVPQGVEPGARGTLQLNQETRQPEFQPAKQREKTPDRGKQIER